MNKSEWETLRDSYWPGVSGKLDELISFEMSKLKTCKPHELPSIQEAVHQLERLKKLPDDIIEAENFGE